MDLMKLGAHITLTCAECGGDISEGEYYYRVEDNFLQAKYFEREKENIFCSKDCLCDNLSVAEYELESKEEE